MKVYVLTRTDTQNGFSPDYVRVFTDFKTAQYCMLSEASFVYDEKDLFVGLESDDVSVGECYVTIRYGHPVWFEIYEQEISLKDILSDAVTQEFISMYPSLKGMEDTVRMLSKNCSDSWQAVGDFINERMVGEEMYQQALQNLGGKVDTKSTATILDYLNEKLAKGKSEDEWFILMLKICKGDETLLKAVRDDIDRNLPEGEKVFQDLQTYVVCCDKSKLQELQTLCDWVEETK